MRALTAAPDLDGWAIVERLLKDLAPLEDRIWLVIDDVHELGSDEARRQLELLVMRAPPELRFVLATRHDLRLGLHRLRLEGELTEIRAADLRFSLAEARELLAAAGVELPEPALAMLYERTEGWAAGLRLAALSLAGHPDPERFAAEFSGSERTVAEYLLAEVLERQAEEVRRLLLRTSVLERVNGELADLLTGGAGGERVLQDLEEANAFVVALDAARSWFRYHHLFADLLQLELRRTAPGEVAALHQRGRRLVRRARVPGGGGPARPGGAGLGAGRPAARRPLARPVPGRAGRHRPRAPGRVPRRGRARPMRSWPRWPRPMSWRRGRWRRRSGTWRWRSRARRRCRPGGAGRLQVLLGVVRLLLARQRGDLPAVAEEARRLQAAAEAPDAAPRRAWARTCARWR